MDVLAIRTPGLGDSTYVLCHDGTGVVVDPQRDIDRFFRAAEDAGVRIRYVLETHVHNDYVSGGRILALEADATHVLPAAAGAAFDFVPAFHQEDIEASSALVIRPLHTPGHTPEHVSYLVLLDGKPLALFSGGSLLVGAVGRTDLLGDWRAGRLAVEQYRSAQRFARLPDDVDVYPTHGGGSYCASGSAGQQASTIGQEKMTNKVFAARDAASFAVQELAGLQPYPAYYPHIAPINLHGPEAIPQPPLPELSPDALAALGDDVYVVDARPRQAFAEGHIPGVLGVELSDEFATWVGWLLPFNAALVLVLDADQDLEEARVQLGRIGFEQLRGVMRGMEAWKAADRPVAQYDNVDLNAFVDALRKGRAPQVLDVRSPGEWQAGHVDGSVHSYLPDLAKAVPPMLSPDQPVWVACASGFRSSIAASLLQRAGYRPLVLSSAGIPDVLDRLRS